MTSHLPNLIYDAYTSCSLAGGTYMPVGGCTDGDSPVWFYNGFSWSKLSGVTNASRIAGQQWELIP